MLQRVTPERRHREEAKGGRQPTSLSARVYSTGTSPFQISRWTASSVAEPPIAAVGPPPREAGHQSRRKGQTCHGGRPLHAQYLHCAGQKRTDTDGLPMACVDGRCDAHSRCSDKRKSPSKQEPNKSAGLELKKKQLQRMQNTCSLEEGLGVRFAVICQLVGGVGSRVGGADSYFSQSEGLGQCQKKTEGGK